MLMEKSLKLVELGSPSGELAVAILDGELEASWPGARFMSCESLLCSELKVRARLAILKPNQ